MVKTIKMDNGLTLIIDNRKDSDFLTMAYMVKKGSYDETADCLGIAHLVEHLVFKGTANRNKDEIWEDIQIVGGTMNAYTSSTHTVFYATALAEHKEVVFDILSDLVWNNTIPETEFDLEKNVVIEELKMYQDDGQSQVFELMNKTLFKDYTAHWTNGGTPESVAKITREQVIDFISNNYIPRNVTLVITGNIDEQEIINNVENYLQDYEFITEPINHREIAQNIVIDEAEETLEGTNQSHLLMYTPIIIENVHDLLCAEILTDIIGGGFGSRLMIIREKYGYAYTVSCDFDYNPQEEAIMFVYAGLNLENVAKTKEIIVQELENLTNGITEAEFTKSYNCLMTNIKKANIMCESTTMSIITRLDEEIPINNEDVINELNKITKEDIMKYIEVNIDVSQLGSALIKQTKMA